MQIYTDYQYIPNIFGELDSFNLESWRFFIWRVGHISFCHLAEKEQRTTDYSKR